MSALDELSVQCERRGWRLALSGDCSPSRPAALRVGSLEVRGRRLDGPRELLAKVQLLGVTAADYDAAALDLAAALATQGLLT